MWLYNLYIHSMHVVGRSGLRSAARGDLVVPGHRTEWGSRVFCCGWSEMLEQIAGWTQRFVGWSETFARRLKTHLFRVGFSDKARTFEFLLHFVGCVTMSG